MNWLFLSPIEAAALWLGAAALAVWFYLHTRRPLRRRVSTLRFWAGVQPVAQPLRRHLREPWALLAQLLFLLFLVLALANPRWGPAAEGRSAVIVMDTSIWSQARVAGGPPWIDKVREQTQRVVDSLPAGDPVLLLSAEAGARPLLPFTIDRAVVRRAIAGAQTSSGVGDLPRALDTGRAALSGSRRGVLVYVGPGMLDDDQAAKIAQFRAAMEKDASGNEPQFLVRLVSAPSPLQNRGITRLSLRRDVAQPDRWHLLTQIKNYNDTKANVGLKLLINGQVLGQGMLSLPPNGSANAEDEFVWAHGGTLQAQITSPDALDADNHATVNLPTFRPVPVALFSTNFFAANDFMSVLAGDPYLKAAIAVPGKALPEKPEVGIYEGVTPPNPLQFNAVWFVSGVPGAEAHPLRVVGWNVQHPVTRWIRTHDVSVQNPAKLKMQPGDTVLASTEGTPPNPLIVAREQNGHKLVMIGFDPRNSNFPQQAAFPLLIAGSMEWMTHPVEDVTDSFSVGEIDLPGAAEHIFAPSGKEIPFARNGASVHLVADEVGLYRVIGPGGGESSVAVNAALLPSHPLVPTATEMAGIERETAAVAGVSLWRWLLVPALAALWIEWWLYYSSRRKAELAESNEQQGETPTPTMTLGAAPSIGNVGIGNVAARATSVAGHASAQASSLGSGAPKAQVDA